MYGSFQKRAHSAKKEDFEKGIKKRISEPLIKSKTDVSKKQTDVSKARSNSPQVKSIDLKRFKQY